MIWMEFCDVTKEAGDWCHRCKSYMTVWPYPSDWLTHHLQALAAMAFDPGFFNSAYRLFQWRGFFQSAQVATSCRCSSVSTEKAGCMLNAFRVFRKVGISCNELGTWALMVCFWQKASSCFLLPCARQCIGRGLSHKEWRPQILQSCETSANSQKKKETENLRI